MFKDVLDGYQFFYPADWVAVRVRPPGGGPHGGAARCALSQRAAPQTAGADVFFRAPLKVEENLFVEASSPSSTRFVSLADLGSPTEAGEQLVRQYLLEFTSTRLGVRREAKLLSAAMRTGGDGREYLDVEVNVQSFAVPQQYGVTEAERGAVQREWDRRLLATLGVANGRLYSMRLQASEENLPSERAQFQRLQESFSCFELE